MVPERGEREERIGPPIPSPVPRFRRVGRHVPPQNVWWWAAGEGTSPAKAGRQEGMVAGAGGRQGRHGQKEGGVGTWGRFCTEQEAHRQAESQPRECMV